MNTATAKSVSLERNITTFEGLEAMRLAWAAVEEFKIDVTNVAESEWVADYPSRQPWRRVCGYGATALEAVENLLRQIGGVE